MRADHEEEGNTVSEPMSHQWWKAGTVYQIYPRSFFDSNADGIGDLRGVREKVDHLAWLGVDAVWLCPIYASPHKDNGYDISDYRSVDPIFGTMADLDELIGALHEREIRVILDLVVNHTSDQHPWFRESSSSPTNPKRDWYIWRPPRPGKEPGSAGAEPTNWESYFSESTWQFDPRSGEYYLHLFAVEQPDLNWDNPEVRDAVYEMMNWWLDRGIDGFRMDVVNLLSKKHPMSDGPLLPHGIRGDGSGWYNYGPQLDTYLKEMHERVFAGRSADLIRIGETPDITVQQAVEISDPANRELDMVFQFEHVSLDRDPQDWKRPRPVDAAQVYGNLVKWQEGLATRGWNSLYWSNHDQPRTVSRFGDDDPAFRTDSAKTLATVLYCMRGTAFVYQGDEIGMTNYPFVSLDEFDDVSATNYVREALARGVTGEQLILWLRETTRDNARTPMQWTGGRNGGFTAGVPWFAVSPNSTAVNVEAQMQDEESVLHHYRKVIAARKSVPALADGEFSDVGTADPRVVAYERSLGDDRALVVANLSSDRVPNSVPERPPWMRGTLLSVGGEISGDALAPWQSVVWVGRVV